MREIGGYIEIDTFRLPMLHESAVKLNCARNALEYIVKAKNIRKMLMPKFMCNTCNMVLRELEVKIRFYSVIDDFKCNVIDRQNDEWLYVVNYYRQLTNEYLSSLRKKCNY